MEPSPRQISKRNCEPCREQPSYVGPDGLLRRHEFTVDVLGGAPGVNYPYAFWEVDGILVATKRRVHRYP